MNKEIKKFYSAFVSDYDDITSFNERLISQRLIIEKLVEKYNIKEALDAGCGTGIYSILLAKSGVKVTAVDISKDMVKKLNHNASKLNVKINTIVSDLKNIDQYLKQKFDAIFCLGNTVPHILKTSDLFRIYKNFFRFLKPSGVLIVQQLNYDRILKERETIQNIKLANDKIYIRFYDYDKIFINFFMLVVDMKHSQRCLLEKVLLKPYLSKDHKKYLMEAGYQKIYFSSDLSMSQSYEKYRSKDLIIVAFR